MDHSAALTDAIRWGASYHDQNIGTQVFATLGQHFPPGTAWCAGFVRDILLHAGIKTPSSWDSVGAIHDWAHGAGLLHVGMAGVQPGDIVGIGSAHTAIVQSVHGNVVTTVAGNSFSANHTVQVQQLHNYWTWHVHMAPVIHGQIMIAGAVASSSAHVAAVHGGGAASLHVLALVHGAAVLTALHFAVPIAAALAIFSSEADATPVWQGKYPPINLITNPTDRLLYKPPGGWGAAL